MKGLSRCEREFILRAIGEGKRLDGRHTYDYRDITISFGSERGHVEVQLGPTRALAQVSCQTVKPQASRPAEGQLFVNVELSPMASPLFEAGKLSQQAVEINRLLERCLRESRAIDTESLCIVAGKLVWTVRVDIHALDDCGDLIGCCSIAAITALTHFRRPDVTVSGEDVTIHSLDERNPVPLSVHHKPVCVLFAFFSNGERLLCDPTNKEEAVMDGYIVVAMNKHRELCCMQLGGGVALQPDEILRCTSIAVVKVMEITEKIDSALLRDERRRKGEVVDMDMDDVDLITKSEKEVVGIHAMEKPIVMKDKVTKQSGCKEKESKLTVLGHGTAVIGHGGLSQWEMNGEDSVLDINGGGGGVKKVNVETKPKRKKAKKAVPVVEIAEDCGSDEEETVVLTGDDVIGKKLIIDREKPVVVEEKGSGVIDLTAALKKKKGRHGKKGKKQTAKNG